MKIVLPKTGIPIDLAYGPLFFLAGPVRGGGDWQTMCCYELRKRLNFFYAAIPCRYEEGHPLMPLRVRGNEAAFDRQLTWERHYLDLASKAGCVLFWLPCEGKESPRTGPDPYAMDTRGELGEWRGRLMANPSLKVVVGAESGFPGLSQIQRNFSQALDRDFPIYPTLAETVRAAVTLAA